MVQPAGLNVDKTKSGWGSQIEYGYLFSGSLSILHDNQSSLTNLKSPVYKTRFPLSNSNNILKYWKSHQ